MSPLISLRVYYAGRVQGVGFRYTVYEIVKHYSIDGYVRNLADGRVELVVQGTASDVEAVLQEIASRFSGNIDRVNRQEIPTDETFQGFQIRH